MGASSSIGNIVLIEYRGINFLIARKAYPREISMRTSARSKDFSDSAFQLELSPRYLKSRILFLGVREHICHFDRREKFFLNR
jgi:hypothetical protein